jgi:hypothetical protein
MRKPGALGRIRPASGRCITGEFRTEQVRKDYYVDGK